MWQSRDKFSKNVYPLLMCIAAMLEHQVYKLPINLNEDTSSNMVFQGDLSHPLSSMDRLTPIYSSMGT